MRKMLWALLLCGSAVAGTSIDERLQGYIQEFNLIPLKAPGSRNQNLFMLGRDLFHDRRLSGNNNISCIECHHPRVGTQDGLPLSLGEGASGIEIAGRKRMQGRGKILARNTPGLFNLHGLPVMFWDGRVEYNAKTKSFRTPVPLGPVISSTMKSALAAQAIFPMVDHDEMRGQKGSNPIADALDEHAAWELIVQKMLSFPEYKKAFAAVFPGEKINIGHLGEALAEFQGHAFFLAETPYDRYLKGEVTALNSQQKHGMEVFFNQAKCGNCHHGEHLSSLGYRSVAAPQIGPGKTTGDDLGRYQWEPSAGKLYAFRIPPLRNVALTAPYFHSGSVETLEEVVKHYEDVRRGLETYQLRRTYPNYVLNLKNHDHSKDNVRLNHLPDNLVQKLALTEEEVAALVEFIRSGLTDIRLQEKQMAWF